MCSTMNVVSAPCLVSFVAPGVLCGFRTLGTRLHRVESCPSLSMRPLPRRRHSTSTTTVHHHGAMRASAVERLNTMQEGGDSQNHTPQAVPRKALLILGDGTTALGRGETLVRILSSQGFMIREIDMERHGASLQDTLSKGDTVFDAGGYVGSSLVEACEEAGAAGLYVYQRSSGMFKKMLGSEDAPCWIDPSAGTSYEQLLDTRGWNFLSEDESEPKYSFQLTEKPPWERAREQHSEDGSDVPALSPLGYSLKRMTDEEVSTAALSLTANQVHVLLEGGTDAPDMSKGLGVEMMGDDGTSGAQVATSAGPASHDGGVYVCALGGLPLFLPEHGVLPIGAPRSGWPGFWRPVHPDHVILREEEGPLRRTEVLCARSGAHLGHVFNDGPGPNVQRFCINRSALKYVPPRVSLPLECRPIHRPTVSVEDLGSFGQALQAIELETATFAGGCFWHVRDDMLSSAGVHEAYCGYVGRIEAVRVGFDPVVVSYESLTRRFFDMHDPTTGDRQGNDWGPQYQAALFPHDDLQKHVADMAIAWARAQLNCAHRDSNNALSDVSYTAATRAVQGYAQRETPRSTLNTLNLGGIPISDDESAGEDSTRIMQNRGGDQRTFAHSGGKNGGNVAATEARELATDVGNTIAAGSQEPVNRDMKKSDVYDESDSVGGQGAVEVVAGAASLPWWEGDDVRTVVVPIREEDFNPEVDKDATVQ